MPVLAVSMYLLYEVSLVCGPVLREPDLGYDGYLSSTITALSCPAVSRSEWLRLREL